MWLVIISIIIIIIVFLYFSFSRGKKTTMSLLKFNPPYMIDQTSLVELLLDLHETIDIERTIDVNLLFDGNRVEPLIPFEVYFSTTTQRVEIVEERVESANDLSVLELKLKCRPNV